MAQPRKHLLPMILQRSDALLLGDVSRPSYQIYLMSLENVCKKRL